MRLRNCRLLVRISLLCMLLSESDESCYEGNNA
jgi:hypothetical protein